MGVIAPELIKLDEVLGVKVIYLLEIVGLHVLRGCFKFLKILLLDNFGPLFVSK